LLVLGDTILLSYGGLYYAGAEKHYFENNVKAAVGRILKDEWTVYKASKIYRIPHQHSQEKAADFTSKIWKCRF
jgi:hypothetical protein